MVQLITSVHNPRVKQAARLRDRKGREQQGRTIIDGAREIERAVAGGVELDEVFVCSELCKDDLSDRALETVSQTRAERFDVPDVVFRKLAFGERAEGLVATARAPRKRLNDLALGPNPLVGVLVSIEKPGNIGAVIRSADGAGVSALLVADGGTDLYNPNVIRASLGVVFTLPVYEASSAEILAWLQAQRFQMLAARVDGPTEYTAVDYHGPTAIILGSEAEGLSTAWNAPDVTAIRLPMLGTADSLNVSCTAAVLFYEARRQRMLGPAKRPV
jgi:RNA methyltransferase, TrmH family